MANVLVTGASGFIGPHLAEALIGRGDRVACMVRGRSDVKRLKALEVSFVYADVTDPDSLGPAVAEADVVYHLAGLTKALRAAELMRINEAGVRNILTACAKRESPPVFLLVSSLAAAGPAPADRLRSEVDPPQPVSNYGRSKRAGEVVAEEFAGRMPITVVRPPIVFGEGDRELLHMVKPIARFGVHMVPGYRQRRFSLVHAGDLAALVIRAADRGARLPPPDGPKTDLGQGYYFAAADEYPTYAELGGLIAQALARKRFRAVYSPELLTWCLAGATQAVSLVRRRPGILSLDKAREAVAGSWTCSAKRAHDDLGFRPAAPLDHQFRRTIDWYRAEGWL